MAEEKIQRIQRNSGKINGTDKQKPARVKPDFRTVFLGIVGAFVAFAMVWGVCQTVRNINTAETMTVQTTAAVKKVEDNSENEGKRIDTAALAEKLLEQVAFDAELNQLEDSVAEGMIETTEATKLQIYMGNGTYADEILIMTAKNQEDAKKNQEYAKVHLQEAKDTFRDYIPKEAKKLENALNVRCGCYVIVCVASDYETAEQIVNSVIKE